MDLLFQSLKIFQANEDAFLTIKKTTEISDNLLQRDNIFIRNAAPAEILHQFDNNFFFSSKVSETKMSVFSMVNKIPSGQFAGRKTVKRTNQEIGMKPYLMWTICGIYSDSVTLK